ncbi:hypothetical protein KW783_01585 [Candidatus Parcubacteria bacterium]|nr:hypothetical protein [Candidatus Parcubacteria bacterium]
MSKTRWLKLGVLILLLIWFSLFIVRKPDFQTVDLGRHLKNGEIFVTQPTERHALLHTNFYSYTETNYPFINHHWGFGVIVYLLWLVVGFKGLTFFYLALLMGALLLFFDVARRYAGLWVAVASLFATLPIIAYRIEIRPEGVTYFFAALFFWILWRYTRENISAKFLWLLPVVMLLWVNIHIGFIFGFAVLAIFLADECIDSTKRRDDKIRNISIALVISGIAGLVNPSFISGLLYPFKIFSNYGYLVFENQSILYLQKLGFNPTIFLLYEIVVVVAWLSFIVAWLVGKKPTVAIFLSTLMATVLSATAIRNLPFMGLFGMVALAINGHDILRISVFKKILIPIYCVAALALFNIGVQNIIDSRSILGPGIMPNVQRPADFLKNNNISGPIFSDYDVGAYMIYNFFPKERVFVDNRPEAYPTNFFRDTYIPVQLDLSRWAELSEKYKFNVIFFNRNEQSQWAQNFINFRINDPQWAVVYSDPQVLIYLRRTAENQAFIQTHEIHFGGDNS